MALNFPNNPSLNDTTFTGGKNWLWDGSRWVPQTITANNIILTGPLTANSSNGNPGEILSSNGSAVYWANNNLDNLSDVIAADLSLNPPSDGNLLTYVASEDKYYVLPLQISNQTLDGGDF